MPYRSECVPAEVFTRVGPGNHPVYHTYKEDDIDQPRQSWFTTDPDAAHGLDEYEFDVRTLPIAAVESEYVGHPDVMYIVRVKAAFDAGLLEFPPGVGAEAKPAVERALEILSAAHEEYGFRWRDNGCEEDSHYLVGMNDIDWLTEVIEACGESIRDAAVLIAENRAAGGEA